MRHDVSLMIPFGKLPASGQDGALLLSRLIAGMEGAGCRVRRVSRDRLDVRVPAWEAAFLPWEPGDRLIVSVDGDGSARLSLDYFSPAQCALHLGVTAVFAAGAWVAPGPAPWRFLGALAVSHAVAALVVVGSLIGLRARLSRAVARARD